jgi:hypothetical protein
MHFSHFGTGESQTGLNPLNKGAVRALECTHRLITASRRLRCELKHCLDAESTISSSTVPGFLSSLVIGAWLERSIKHLALRYTFNHDYASDFEENDNHCLHLRCIHYYFW